MKNLFKFLLLGAFTLSLGVGFVGCKNYDSDIDGICTRLDALEGDVAKLKTDLAAITQDGNHYVTSAELGGAPNYTLTLTLNNGNKVTVDLKSLSEVPAAGTPPTVDPTEVHYPKLTGNETDGWEIEVWDTSKNPAAYTKITLPGANSVFSKIDILGWVSAATAGSTSNYVGNSTPWSGDATKTLSAANMLDADTNTFNVNYSYIDSFYTGDVDYTGTTTAGQPATKANTWTSGNKTVVKGGVLNTMEEDKAGFIVQAFPSTADLTNTKFTMEASDGTVLPVAFGTPVKISGVLTTRATSGSSLWFVPGDNTTETFAAAAALPYASNYMKRFVDKARWALVAGGEVVSEYTPFSIASAPYTSKEGAVLNIQGTATDDEPLTKSAYAAGVNVPGAVDVNNVYIVEVGKAYKVNFSIPTVTEADSYDKTTGGTITAATTPGITDAVIDYTLKTHGDIDVKMFDVKFNTPINTEFTINVSPDVVTMVPLVLEVTKLGVDGKIYAERINVLPERKLPYTLIPLGNYPIVDATPTVSTDYVGGSLVVPLTDMFTTLKGYDFSSTVKMDEAWASQRYGAKTYAITKMVIKGAGAAGADVTLDATTTPTLSTFGGALNTQGTTDGVSKGVVGSDKVDGTLAATPISLATDTWKSKSIVFDKLPYGVANGAFEGVITGYPANGTNANIDQAWIIGKEYQVTMQFVDTAGTVLNIITFTFTPTMPALAALFVPDPAYWTPEPWVSTSVLNAYYQDPATYSATIIDSEFIYDAKQAVKGSGFKSYTAGVTWSILKPATDATATPPFTQGDYVTYTQVNPTVTTTTTDMVFQLLKQTVATADETADNVDYDADGAMTTTSVSNVSVDLLPAASTVKPAYNLYKTELTIAPTSAYNYLGTYILTPAQREALGYKMRIMSAMYEGDIEVKSTGGITLQPVGTPQKLDGTMIGGVKYNKVEKYDLFPVATATSAAGVAQAATDAAYDWTYIAKVEYLVHKDYVNNYSFADADGVKITGRAVTIADFFSTKNAVAAGDKGFLNIIANTTTNEVKAKFTVRVSDRFGKVKEKDIDFTIAKPTSKR